MAKQTPAEITPEPLKCTVADCQEPRADQDPEATNRHCRSHRNEATKRYIMTKMEQDQKREFLKGVAAMREYFAGSMEGYPPLQRWTGAEIAAIMRRVSGPKFPDTSLPGAVS